MTWITTFLLFTASITGAIYGFLSAINAPLTPTGKILVGILAIALFLVAEARIKAVLYADNGEVATDSNGLADS